MIFFNDSSPVDFSVMMPSPLNCVSAKIPDKFEVSCTEMVVFLVLPRFFRICLAEANKIFPSSVWLLMADRGNSDCSFIKSSGFLMTEVIHCTAAITSGTRMRLSLSVSINCKVSGSISSPSTGQLKAAHSF